MFSLSAAGLLPLLSLIPSARAFCGHRLPHHTLYRRQEGNASIPAEMEAEKPAFGYGIADGPLNWAHLSADFSLCATGMRQSPILLDQSFLSAGPGSVRLDMPVGTDVVFENLGTTVEVVASGTLQAADDPTNSTWDLAQFHFHTPSEHRVNLAHADGEMHMVFKSAADPNQIAVVAFMIEMSADATTPMLETAFAQLNEIAEEGSSTTIPILDFSEFLAGVPEQSFFRYGGSLTTPPCSETVEWYVAEKAIPLSVAAYRSLRTSTKANNRNTQNAPGQPSVLTLAAEGGMASAAGLSEFVVDAGVPAAEVQNASESAQAEAAVPAVENLAEATPLSESITNPPASAATAVAVVAASAPGVRHNPLVPVKRMRRIR